ncbi:hypothetical protein COCCADRAFT_29349 [Bipolaris zeicola 26-R-13]|uniref:Uncharacterized protein n=1 Tax=Cochliobolus carbonum (strain 26-R-13) TaxID=930089 RepID=W6YEJ2_COCC2|nr:uncharacterized protein COCCADRAFT_29349 [Bipolaris zeicola 26-R-13]EUC29596.1 hypothetical protein COCCADRAFT_29349 [Bipolaris zeicola 26-R-13]
MRRISTISPHIRSTTDSLIASNIFNAMKLTSFVGIFATFVVTSSASAPVTGSYCCTSGANTDPSTGRAAYCCQSGSNPNIGSGCDYNHNYPVGHHDVALSSGGCGPDGNGFVGEQY